MIKNTTAHSLRGLLHAVQSRMPAQILIAAELRRIWPEIVGMRIAQKSQIAEYKYGGLLVWVDSPEWQTELTLLKGSILEKIPRRFKVRDVRFVLLKNKALVIKSRKESQYAQFSSISEEEQQAVRAQIAVKNFDTEFETVLCRFLCLCRAKKT